jgi:hypothetical protein
VQHLHPGCPPSREIRVNRQPGAVNDPGSRSTKNQEVQQVKRSEGVTEQLQPPTVEDVDSTRRFSIEIGFFPVAFDDVNHVVIARGTETRPVAATFCPARNQSADGEAVSEKFWRRSGNAEPNEGIFQAEFEFGHGPRYDRKDDPDGANRRRNCLILQ